MSESSWEALVIKEKANLLLANHVNTEEGAFQIQEDHEEMQKEKNEGFKI